MHPNANCNCRYADVGCDKMEEVMDQISGKWKMRILFMVGAHGTLRYGELRRLLDGVTHKMLSNQLKELGIEVKTEGADWETAYDKAQSQPLMWGWGAHTPMELYNIYHTMSGKKYAQYSPYSNPQTDQYMDQALACSDLEESYELWKKAQWDGETGIVQDGDIPWIWLVNIDHLYWSKKGLHVAEQKLHPHGHGWSIVNNVDQWTWE